MSHPSHWPLPGTVRVVPANVETGVTHVTNAA